MKVNLIAASLGVAIATTGATYGQTSSQVAFPASPAEVTQPATGVLMHPEYAKAIARTAYVWGWPMVNMTNRRAAVTRCPNRAAVTQVSEPGRLNGVLMGKRAPAARDRRPVACEAGHGIGFGNNTVGEAKMTG